MIQLAQLLAWWRFDDTSHAQGHFFGGEIPGFLSICFVFWKLKFPVRKKQCAQMSRWWFQTVFIFTPTWGRFPI